MCGFNGLSWFKCIGDQCLIKKKYLCILTQATIKCAFLRDKNVYYYYYYYEATQTCFLIWNNITQSMQKLRNTCFYLDIYFAKENEGSSFYNFHFGAKIWL